MAISVSCRRLRAIPIALVLAACSSTVDGEGQTTPGPGNDFTSVGASAAPSAAPSSAPAALDENKIDPCSLVTKAEADGVAGVTTMDPVRALTLCTWATPTSGTVGQFEVIIGDGAKKGLDIDRDTLKHEFTTVSGVGEEAYLETGNLFFRTQNLWVQLRVTRLDDVDTGPMLKQIALSVIGRL